MKHPKLQLLAELEGYNDVLQFLEASSIDSVVPAICMNDDCDYTTELEPDGDGGHCEICQTPTVKSCMLIAGII